MWTARGNTPRVKHGLGEADMSSTWEGNPFAVSRRVAETRNQKASGDIARGLGYNGAGCRSRTRDPLIHTNYSFRCHSLMSFVAWTFSSPYPSEGRRHCPSSLYTFPCFTRASLGIANSITCKVSPNLSSSTPRVSPWACNHFTNQVLYQLS